MGEAKAVTVLAALELGRRRHLSDLRERPRVNSSRDAFNAIAPLLSDLTHEEFWVLLLNRANEIFARERISMGGMSGTVVDMKKVLKAALDVQAAAFIADHMTKPVTCFIAGQTAPPGRRMGHAGAIISGGEGTAAEKMAMLKAAGAQVARHPDEIAEIVANNISK